MAFGRASVVFREAHAGWRIPGFSPLAAALLSLGACSDATKTTEAAKPPTPPPTPFIAAVSDLSQQATVDHVVPSNPVVRVTDQAGNPLSGIHVVFSDARSPNNPTVITGRTAWPRPPGNCRGSQARKR